MSVAHQHTSGTAEHYTPAAVVEAARAVLGGIDLDPFSCDAANRVIRASLFYGVTDDGFERPWSGRVFLNPPGSKRGKESMQKLAWFRLMAMRPAVASAIFVCFNVSLLQTTQYKLPRGALVPLDFPICYPSKRLAFTREDGTTGGNPPHPSCIVGVDVDADRFRDCFGPIGKVVIPR